VTVYFIIPIADIHFLAGNMSMTSTYCRSLRSTRQHRRLHQALQVAFPSQLATVELWTQRYLQNYNLPVNSISNQSELY